MHNIENTMMPQLFKSYIVSKENKAVPCGDRIFNYYRMDVLRTPFP